MKVQVGGAARGGGDGTVAGTAHAPAIYLSRARPNNHDVLVAIQVSHSDRAHHHLHFTSHY